MPRCLYRGLLSPALPAVLTQVGLELEVEIFDSLQQEWPTGAAPRCPCCSLPCVSPCADEHAFPGFSLNFCVDQAGPQSVGRVL